MKLFGLRITPFLLFIFSLECLAFLLSIYMGILLYQDASIVSHSIELIDYSFYSGMLLIILLSILTPSFFYQTKVISHIKKSVNEKAYGFAGAIITMLLILVTNTSDINSKTIFIAALLSAFVGLLISQANVLSKYWRFMIRSGVN